MNVMAKVLIDRILKKELKTRKMSLNHLARECAIPASVLHGWVNGTLPSARNLHHIQTLSIYLGVSVDELLFGVKDQGLNRDIIFSSTFVDGETRYKFVIERIT